MRRISQADAEGLRYIGSENPDGSIYEAAADAIDQALFPVFFIDSDGARHYFEGARYYSEKADE